jgi:hypothetical protein
MAGTTEHTVYKGSVVVCDISDCTTGYFRAAPLCSTTALGTSDVFGGISVEHKHVTSTDLADNAVKVTVAVDGVWGFPVNSLTTADLGKPIYAYDDGNTVTSTSTDAMWIGYLVDVDATYAWVDIAPAAGRLNSAT